MSIRHERDQRPGVGGGLIAAHVVSMLGLAVLLPRLALRGVATRPETAEPDQAEPTLDSGRRDNEPEPEQAPSAADDSPAIETESVVSAGPDSVSPNGDDRHAAAEGAGRATRPRRVRANPSRRRARGEPAPDADSIAANGAGPLATDEASVDQGTAKPEAAPERATEAAATGAATSRPSREDRRLAKARQRQEAKEKRREQKSKDGSTNLPKISYEDGQAAHVAMVRHINSLTVSLNEAHRLIGRLNQEKYQAQRELAIAKKQPLPPPLPDPSWTRATHAGPHAVRKLQRDKAGDEAPEFDPEELARIRASIKRRRTIVLGVVVLLVAAIAGYRMTDWTWFPDISDREALTQLAGIGAFIQIFFIGWIFFRFARIGGKGARWLFPDMEEEHRKQRRKQRR